MSDAKPLASLSGGLLARKGGARPAMRRPATVASDGSAIEPGMDDLGWNDMGYDVNPDPDAPMDHKHGKLNALSAAVPEATPEVKKQQQRIAAQLSAGAIGSYPKEGLSGQPASKLPLGGVWAPDTEGQDDSEIGATGENETAADEGLAAEAATELADENVTAFPVSNVPTPVPHTANLAEEPRSDVSESTDEAQVETTDEAQADPAVDLAQKLAAVRREVADSAPVIQRRKRAEPGSKSKAAFTLRLDKERHLKLRLATAVSNKSAQRLVTEALDRMLEDMPEIKALAANVNTDT